MELAKENVQYGVDILDIPYLFPGVRGLNLRTHFHIMPRSKMSEAKPPLPIHLHGVMLNKYQG
jgi:hypothetical protein